MAFNKLVVSPLKSDKVLPCYDWGLLVYCDRKMDQQKLVDDGLPWCACLVIRAKNHRQSKVCVRGTEFDPW